MALQGMSNGLVSRMRDGKRELRQVQKGIDLDAMKYLPDTRTPRKAAKHTRNTGTAHRMGKQEINKKLYTYCNACLNSMWK